MLESRCRCWSGRNVAAPSEWRERARGGARELAVWAGVERPEQSEPMGTSGRC
jgi:hypothetical protein